MRLGDLAVRVELGWPSPRSLSVRTLSLFRPERLEAFEFVVGGSTTAGAGACIAELRPCIPGGCEQKE
jgi:hypothetical protein